MTIGKETTFKELKKIVGSTKGMKKLPTAKALRESKEEIVFDGDCYAAVSASQSDCCGYYS